MLMAFDIVEHRKRCSATLIWIFDWLYYDQHGHPPMYRGQIRHHISHIQSFLALHDSLVILQSQPLDCVLYPIAPGWCCHLWLHPEKRTYIQHLQTLKGELPTFAHGLQFPHGWTLLCSVRIAQAVTGMWYKYSHQKKKKSVFIE